jgi:hypothetical protein
MLFLAAEPVAVAPGAAIKVAFDVDVKASVAEASGYALTGSISTAPPA